MALQSIQLPLPLPEALRLWLVVNAEFHVIICHSAGCQQALSPGIAARYIQDKHQATRSKCLNQGPSYTHASSLSTGRISSLRAAECAYDIPYTSLYRRNQGTTSRSDSISPNLKLIQTEETTLVKWILSLDTRGLPPIQVLIHQMAKLLLAERVQNASIEQTKPGKLWVYRFINRHDRHRSYITAEFNQYTKQNLIIIVCIPPRSLHILQPLDVSCFAVLKRLYRQAVEAQMQVGINHIDEDDFLTLYQEICPAVFQSGTIQSGFRATGIVSFDPDQVLSELHI